MAKIITLNGYGVCAPDIHVVTEHIISFHEIEFNGRVGTEMLLSNGKTIRAGEKPYKIKNLLGES